LTIHRAEPFEAQMQMFVEDGGIRAVPIAVKGVGIDPGESKHDRPAL
jgi:hypothetical protein